MKKYLGTERLILRELDLSDQENIFELDSDPEVMKYLTDGKPSTMDEIKRALVRTEELYKKHNRQLGFWASIEKSTSQFMGWFHFRPSKLDIENTNRIELGYRLKKDFWGKGFATEGSRALIKKGFEELGVEEVFAITMKDNLASQKVMEKAGLTFVREFYNQEFPGTKELDVEYAVDRHLWLEWVRNKE